MGTPGQGHDRHNATGFEFPARGKVAALILVTVSIFRLATQSPASRGDGSESGALPRDAVETVAGFADESRCVECHAEAEQFAQTGHAATLTRADSTESLAALNRLNRTRAAIAEGVRVEITSEGIRAVHSLNDDAASGPDRELTLDWCFGSGEHARTWVGTLTDSWGATDLVEFRWTWYHSIDDFDVTPGQPDEPPDGYFQRLGLLYDHPKTRKCFACHATALTFTDGSIDSISLKPGVTCQRCHGPRQTHVQSDGHITDSFWKTATQKQSVDRCAVCHRRADEQNPESISPDNPDIVRFQPVGLVQSACFLGSPKMTCMTCHDPHRPLSAQDSLGIRQCVQCHDGSDEHNSFCGLGRKTDCLRCHMPKVRNERPVEFTDHWIRIRRPGTTPAKDAAKAAENGR